MLKAIEFKAKRFRRKDDYNLFSPITENAIILCYNYKLMDFLTKEILNTVNGDAEYNDYDCDLEPAIIYKANSMEDIWFFDCSGTDEIETLPPYEEFIYPMFIFKGSHKIWEDGKDEVYKIICNGRYGIYDGRWVDLEGNHYQGYRATNAGKCNLHLND